MCYSDNPLNEGLRGKIDIIAFVRNMTNFDLKEAKTVVDVWGNAYNLFDNQGHLRSPLTWKHVFQLSKIAKKILSEEWEIDENSIFISKTVDLKDIENL